MLDKFNEFFRSVVKPALNVKMSQRKIEAITLKLFNLFIFLGALSGLEAEGWFPVEKKGAPPTEKRNESVHGVYFGHNLGTEKFLVRFVEDPSYHYLNEIEMELEAKGSGVEQRLQVLKRGTELVLAEELITREGDAWLYETHYATAAHHYIFQTKSLNADGVLHRQFVSSLDVELT